MTHTTTECTWQENVPLAPRTSFRIGGRARFLATPKSPRQMQEVLDESGSRGLPRFLLGGGTNLLLRDEDFPGVVISTRRWTRVVDLGGGKVEIHPGTILRSAVLRTLEWGYAGLQTLVGIPGTVGGAVYGNAGAADVWMSRHLLKVKIYHPRGAAEWVTPQQLDFGYRQSGIGDGVVGEVQLQLEPGADPRELRQQADAVFAHKYATQPMQAHSAGCIFRNPATDAAGRWVELAGLKGVSIGGARVSTQHANFIVNDGGASYQDVTRLIERVRAAVRSQFGEDLHCEVVTPQEECEWVGGEQ